MPRYTVRPALTSRRVYSFGDPSARQSDLIRLGRLAEAGQTVDVTFDVSGEFVVGIFGKRGSGKSYCLGSMLESLCTQEADTSIGRCSRRRAILLFDTLNIFWTTGQPFDESEAARFPREFAQLKSWALAPTATDVMVVVPRGFAGEATPSDFKELAFPPSALAVDDWADLLEIDLFSDRIGQLLFDIHNKVTTEGWKTVTGPEPATPNYTIQMLVDCMRSDTEVAEFYSPETIRALGQRLKAVAQLSFFGESTMTLSDFLSPGRLTVVLLNRLPDTLRSVLTSVLMRRILGERAEASELHKQLTLNRRLTPGDELAISARLAKLIPPTVVALDEAQNVLPSERATKATQTIIKYVREGRNHGLSFVFTTQQPSAIDARILAQVDTLVGHKLTIAADVRRFEDNLKSRPPDSVQLGGRELNFADWLRSLAQGQAIVSNTDEDRHFVIDVRPRICPHGGQGSV